MENVFSKGKDLPFAAESDGERIPGSTTDLGEGELDAPDLTLVAETELANGLQLSVAGCTLDI